VDKVAVETLLNAIGARANGVGRNGLTEHEKNLFVPPWLVGIVRKGGFEFYFADREPYDLADAAIRLRALGFEAAADAVSVVSERVFPDGMPASYVERRRRLDQVNWSQFELQEGVVFAVEWQELLAAVIEYAALHRAALADYGDLLQQAMADSGIQ
jgi:hypothetical protein